MMKRGSKAGSGPLATLLLLAAGLGGCGDGRGSFAGQAWVELGPDGSSEARVITTAEACPDIVIDGRVQPMSVRAAPEPPTFPVLTCETTLPPGTKRAVVRGAAAPLPLPPRDPQRIAVIGDTGCRIETGHPSQACNDPKAWPFADLARAVAKWQPDLVVHVGDYLYRESPCPAGDQGCAGSPWGYDWAAIDADFFSPADPLFRVAPLVLTRGNHESCNRAGPVWFRFLDPRPLEAECNDYTEPYAVEIGGLQLLMLDSSAASDTSVDPTQVALYRQQFARLDELAGPHALLLTHRPMWAFGHLGEMNGVETLFRDNPTLQAASENVLPAGVELVVSGHIHLFELLTFDPFSNLLRAPQIVIGNSGTSLDPPITTALPGLEIAGATVSLGETSDRFGWVSLEREGASWSAILRDVAGRPSLDCQIAERMADCRGSFS
jgi:hypothetical protein